MRNNDALKSPRSGRVNGFIPSSFRAISSYLKIVSSGASTVARSAASVASSIVDRVEDSSSDQVNRCNSVHFENFEMDSLPKLLFSCNFG